MSESSFLKSGEHDPASYAFFDANSSEWYTRARLLSRIDAVLERLQFPIKAIGFHFGLEDAAGLIAYQAALESGHAVVMLDPQLDPAMKARLIALFQPDFLIAPVSHAPAVGPEYDIAESPEPGQ